MLIKKVTYLILFFAVTLSLPSWYLADKWKASGSDNKDLGHALIVAVKTSKGIKYVSQKEYDIFNMSSVISSVLFLLFVLFFLFCRYVLKNDIFRSAEDQLDSDK